MKMIFNKIYKFFYGGESKEFFIENKERITSFNLKIISIILIIMTIVPLIYLIFFLKGTDKAMINMKTCCLIYFLIFLLTLELHHFVIKKNIKNVYLYFVIICELIFSFLLFVGPVYDVTNLACFIPMFFLATFLLAIIPFPYLIIPTIINFTIFLIIDKAFNVEEEIFLLNIANCLTALILGITIGYSIIKSRVSLLTSYNKLKESSESELKKALDKAFYDTLTGLQSRSAYQVLESNVSKEIRNKTKPEFAIVYCDINDLKSINDTYGHSAGDSHIIRCAKILKEVFEDCPVYRLSGDEFMIYLRDEAFNNRKKYMEQIKYAPFSSGIAVYDFKKDTCMRDVVARADHNMYKVKDKMKEENKNQAE